MELESPDVEKDFPGLYMEGSGRKANDSDYSDDSHDKSFKKDIIAKRKEKKDKNKDKGYAALEGESSPDEDDSKSPSKVKKTKHFKFPVKKSEKREKSREKESKEKETGDKEKKKDKKEKSKSKEKDVKKKKKTESIEQEDLSVFGVNLQKCVDRLGCLDGINLPLPVRQTIECISEHGLVLEGVYKLSNTKNKSIESLKKIYNTRGALNPTQLDPYVAAGLLMTFLKELPESILTEHLGTRFEEAAAIKEVRERELELNQLIIQLPDCNRTLLAWLIVHFDQVTQHEKQNKLNAQSIAMIFSPVLQMSHRLLTAFLCHSKFLFPDAKLEKYSPPLTQGSSFPDDMAGIISELRKQEALLNQIHMGMNEGFVSKRQEEQLWEHQRIVTQLKRKLKGFQKLQEAKDDVDLSKSLEKINLESNKVEEEEKKMPEEENAPSHQDQQETVEPAKPLTWDSAKVEKLKFQLEQAELTKFKSSLEDRIYLEKILCEKLKQQIETYRGFMDSESDESSNDSTPACLSPETEAKLERLVEENVLLKQKRNELIKRIVEEREACIKLNIYINIIERMYTKC